MEEPLSPGGAKATPPGPTAGALPRVAAVSLPSFVVATEWLDDGVPVISVTGELDLLTAPALEDSLLAVPEGASGAVIVDLARCTFIDLRGLRILLAARERLERSSRPLVLVAGNPNVLRVFTVTRVADLFTIHPSLAAAAETIRDA